MHVKISMEKKKKHVFSATYQACQELYWHLLVVRILNVISAINKRQISVT